jgi:hypothetical protein
MRSVIRSVAVLFSLAFLLSVSVSLNAQTTPIELPQNHIDVLGFYNPNATPGGSLSGGYSHKIAENTVSISMVDVTFNPFTDKTANGIVNNVMQAKISTTSGLGQRITSQFGWAIFAVGALGAQTTPGGGSAAGFSGTTGFVGTRPIGSKGLTADFAVRVIAGTGPPQYVFGLGFGFGK